MSLGVFLIVHEKVSFEYKIENILLLGNFNFFVSTGRMLRDAILELSFSF